MTEAPNCAECGVPAEILSGQEMKGVERDGTPALFWTWTVQCVMGHRYLLIDEERSVKL